MASIKHWLTKIRWPKWLGVLLLLAVIWALAGLAWQIWLIKQPSISAAATPQQNMLLPPSAPTISFAQAAGNLFGTPIVVPPVASAEIIPSTLPLTLTGVIAPRNGVAAAIITGAEPITAVKTGQMIQEGVFLERVYKDHIIIRNQGQLERLDLQAIAAASLNGQAASPPAVGGMPSGSVPAPYGNPAAAGGFVGGSTLPRDVLNATMKEVQAQAWQQGVEAQGSGAKILPNAPQPIISMLQLQPDDVVQSINGRPIRAGGDIASQLSGQSMLDFSIVRGGSPMRYQIQIQ